MQERITFDHYRVCQRDDGARVELGRGAAGVTFRALDVNLESPVALKVLNADLFRDETSRAAFVREARAAARLRHRHIASVYHLGSDQDHFFYAMELVEGETAETLVRRAGPLPPETALRIVLQVARALAAANREGIVHGDIKPANLLIAADPSDVADGLFVKVIDFGMACSLHEGVLAEREFQSSSQYASPEQLEERELDGRSDFYSLGCTLWFLLTGHPPFARRLADILGSRGEPMWEELDQFPPALRKLLRIMLRRNPAERPRDGLEVQRAIEMSLARIERWRNVKARVSSSFEHGRRWMAARRSRQAAACAALALIAGIGAWAWLRENASGGAPSLEVAEASLAPVAEAPRNAEERGPSLEQVALRDADWLAANAPAPVATEIASEPDVEVDEATVAAPIADEEVDQAPAVVKKKASSSVKKSRSKPDESWKAPIERVHRTVHRFLSRLF